MSFNSTFFKSAYYMGTAGAHILIATLFIKMVVENNLPFELSKEQEIPGKIMITAGCIISLLKGSYNFGKAGYIIHKYRQECVDADLRVTQIAPLPL